MYVLHSTDVGLAHLAWLVAHELVLVLLDRRDVAILGLELIAWLSLGAYWRGFSLVDEVSVWTFRSTRSLVELSKHLAWTALILLIDWLDLVLRGSLLPSTIEFLHTGVWMSSPLLVELIRHSHHDLRVLLADVVVRVACTGVAEPVVLSCSHSLVNLHELHDWLWNLCLFALEISHGVIVWHSQLSALLFFLSWANWCVHLLSIFLIKGTHLSSLILVKLEVELIELVIVLRNGAGIVEVQMSTVQERVRVSSGSLLVAQVSVGGCSLVRIGIWVFLGVLLSRESLQVTLRVDLIWKRATSWSTYWLLSQSQDLRLHVVLLLLSWVNFLLGHLELILSTLEMVCSLHQVRQVGVASEACKVDVWKAVEVVDQLVHESRVCSYLLRLSLHRRAGSFFLLVGLPCACVLRLHRTWHQLIDFVVGFLNLDPQNLFHLHWVLSLHLLWQLLTNCTWFTIYLLLILLLLLGRWCLESFSHLVLKELSRRRWLRNERLDGEWYHRTTNLDCLGHFRLEFDLSLGQDKCSKLWQVVFEIEPTILQIVLDESMASTYRNIRYAHVTLMSSTKFEVLLFIVRHDQMNHPRAILFECQGF